jgi:predicted metal-dependent phosphoesterase TrpH
VPAEPTFDLQSHSTHSDGALAPAEVVEKAADAGVKLLALTDHDTVAGVAEALHAARVKNIDLTPAVELSSVHADAEDLHLLGYEIDHTDSTLLDALEDFRSDRIRRIVEMAERLGIEPPDHPSPGRPHLADQLQRRHPDMTRDELFAAYLTAGAPTYVRRTRPTVQQAIEIVHAAGGLAVWAHPYWDVEEPRLDDFPGLDGVEVFYPSHTEEQTRALYAAARERGLLTTGSADFHGPAHEHFDRFLAFSLYGLEPDLGRLGE